MSITEKVIALISIDYLGSRVASYFHRSPSSAIHRLVDLYPESRIPEDINVYRSVESLHGVDIAILISASERSRPSERRYVGAHRFLDGLGIEIVKVEIPIPTYAQLHHAHSVANRLRQLFEERYL